MAPPTATIPSSKVEEELELTVGEPPFTQPSPLRYRPQNIADADLINIKLEKRDLMHPPHSIDESESFPQYVSRSSSNERVSSLMSRTPLTLPPPSDFKKLVKTAAYVDNAEAVVFLRLFNQQKVEIFPFPHGWGKTTLLSTMKAAYAKVALGSNNELSDPVSRDEIFSWFAGTSLLRSEYFDGAKDDLGKYFVVHLDFKKVNDFILEDVPELIFSLNSQIILFNAAMKDILERDEYALFKKQARNALKNYEPFHRLIYLFQKIMKFYKAQAVIVLIDNFDRPVVNSLSMPKEAFETFELHYDRFLNRLEETDIIKKVVLFGSSFINLPSIATYNYSYIYRIQRTLESYFAWNEEKVNGLLSRLAIRSSFISELEQFVEGYNRDQEPLYSPRGV